MNRNYTSPKAVTKEAEQQKRWVRIFHTVCTNTGVSRADKEAIYLGQGVTTSKDLTVLQLQEIVAALNGKSDSWRKKTMAAIGGWLNAVNYEQNGQYIKSIACRAAGCTDFNKIPIPKLQKIYYSFVKKERTTAACDIFKNEVINYLKNNN